GDVIGPGVEVQHVLRQVGVGPAVPDGDTLVQDTHAGDALFATGDEDQGGHARGDHQQHRDLPEGVPDTGVDQGHVDHVVAAADLVGGFDQAAPQGLAVAGVGRVQRGAAQHHGGRDGDPPAAPGPDAQGPTGEVD